MADTVGTDEETPGARILIVDDDALMRRKLEMECHALGHVAQTVESGDRALERLAEGGVNLIFLDMVMPEVDGFEVLKRMNELPALRKVPVIVVSSLEEPDAVARAITLGAADFQPKAFNEIILRARIDTCLRDARRRATDLRTLQDLHRITVAAEALDTDERNPHDMEIDDIALRTGALGMLARVLLNKSISVYNRRQVQLQQIRTLVGVMLLLLIGVAVGIKPALAALSLAGVGDPLSVGFLSVAISAAIIATYAGLTGRDAKWPRLSNAPLIFCLALLAPVLPQLLLFVVAGKVNTVTLAILMSLEAEFVFALAKALRTEQPSLRRICGLGLGLAGVALILVPAITLGTSTGWLMLAACVPACFSIRTIALGNKRMRGVDAAPLAACLFITASIILFALLVVSGRITMLPDVLAATGFVLPIFAIAEAVGAIALIALVRNSRTVFAGPKSFTTAIGGVVWSVIILGSVIGLETGLSIFLLLIGSVLVAKPPKESNFIEASRNLKISCQQISLSMTISEKRITLKVAGLGKRTVKTTALLAHMMICSARFYTSSSSTLKELTLN